MLLSFSTLVWSPGDVVGIHCDYDGPEQTQAVVVMSPAYAFLDGGPALLGHSIGSRQIGNGKVGLMTGTQEMKSDRRTAAGMQHLYNLRYCWRSWFATSRSFFTPVTMDPCTPYSIHTTSPDVGAYLPLSQDEERTFTKETALENESAPRPQYTFWPSHPMVAAFLLTLLLVNFGCSAIVTYQMNLAYDLLKAR